MMHDEPELAHQLLSSMADSVATYASHQASQYGSVDEAEPHEVGASTTPAVERTAAATAAVLSSPEVDASLVMLREASGRPSSPEVDASLRMLREAAERIASLEAQVATTVDADGTLQAELDAAKAEGAYKADEGVGERTSMEAKQKRMEQGMRV